jgi:HlyD family secretion protein
VRRSLSELRLERGAPAPPRGNRRRVAWIGAVVLVLAVIALQLGRGRGAVVEVAQASLPQAAADGAAGVPVLSGAGYVVSADRYISIGVRVTGRIDRYMVEEGDHVQSNDPLVQLDARDYEAAVKHAEANLRQARATARLRETQLSRARKLALSGVISRDDLDLRAAEAETARAGVGQADAELTGARRPRVHHPARTPPGA